MGEPVEGFDLSFEQPKYGDVDPVTARKEYHRLLRRDFCRVACGILPLRVSILRAIRHATSHAACHALHSKFKAVNNRDKNFTKAKVERAQGGSMPSMPTLPAPKAVPNPYGVAQRLR
jgi:hypothetical protein